MRLLERTLRWIAVAPRAVGQDDLGGVTEGFSAPVIRVRAAVMPMDGGVLQAEAGLRQDGAMRLLLPLNAKVAPGDGICLEGETPEWRCVDVQKWSTHQTVRAVRIAG